METDSLEKQECLKSKTWSFFFFKFCPQLNCRHKWPSSEMVIVRGFKPVMTRALQLARLHKNHRESKISWTLDTFSHSTTVIQHFFVMENLGEELQKKRCSFIQMVFPLDMKLLQQMQWNKWSVAVSNRRWGAHNTLCVLSLERFWVCSALSISRIWVWCVPVVPNPKNTEGWSERGQAFSSNSDRVSGPSTQPRVSHSGGATSEETNLTRFLLPLRLPSPVPELCPAARSWNKHQSLSQSSLKLGISSTNLVFPNLTSFKAILK